LARPEINHIVIVRHIAQASRRWRLSAQATVDWGKMRIMSKRPSGRRVKWLNPTILGIGLASLFSDVGVEMATTAMPALLASVGASSAMLGLIEGLADSLSSFAKLLSSLYSDKFRKRKPLAVAGYFVTASGMASFAIASKSTPNPVLRQNSFMCSFNYLGNGM
jgi:hypothetical protein